MCQVLQKRHGSYNDSEHREGKAISDISCWWVMIRNGSSKWWNLKTKSPDWGRRNQERRCALAPGGPPEPREINFIYEPGKAVISRYLIKH
jgi:hypothetical protein